MKPNEIKKCLECCCSKTEMFCTKDCPLYEYNGNCWYAMKFDTLAYINQLEAEVERLEKHELREAMKFNSDTIKRCTNEAIKEFAEKIKSKIYIAHFGSIKRGFNVTTINPSDIDNLVKEMVDE